MKKIELNLSHFNFYCPVTGHRILQDGEEFSPSPATLFAYLDIIGEFIYSTNQYQEIIDKNAQKFSEDDEFGDYENLELIINESENANLLIFEITNSGVACGPSSSTLFLCIDMNYNKEN